MERTRTYEDLQQELEALRWQLEEANETIHAIRTGQVDAIVVQSENGPELYSLKTADQTYRVFIEQMNEGALTLDTEGTILYCNGMFAHMLGEEKKTVLGKTLLDFIPEQYHEEYRKVLQQAWEVDAKIEISINAVQGQLPCQLSVTTLKLDEGLALSMIVTDLSYQKEVQRLLQSNNARLEATNSALEKSNNDLLQFASVASHDLQEPLRKIMVFAGMVQKGLSNNGNNTVPEQLLEKIAISSHRMKDLIADILAYSRLAQDGIAPMQVDLKEVVAEIVDDFEVVITEKKATVEVDGLPNCILADRGQMRQVFQNLLSNALKFSRPDVPPHIFIGSQEDPNQQSYIITVRDNGIGFDDKYGDKIFTLFQRLHTKDKYEGSGIGLSVTKKIIERHGGSISATSVEGQGSEFTIILPKTSTSKLY